jgi:hypothetical protein
LKTFSFRGSRIENLELHMALSTRGKEHHYYEKNEYGRPRPARKTWSHIVLVPILSSR